VHGHGAVDGVLQEVLEAGDAGRVLDQEREAFVGCFARGLLAEVAAETAGVVAQAVGLRVGL
jgi:hypothetical protein